MASTSSGGGEPRRLFEFFIVAGLKDTSQEMSPAVHENGSRVAEVSSPITDICVIFPGLGESTPEGFECIETTPLGYPADLNHGSWTSRAHSAFLCFRRGHHKPPLTDLGVLDEGRGEKPMMDAVIVDRTPYGHSANVNNTSHGLYFTTRRAKINGAPHQLVITDICVIITSKGEVPPHTYYKIDKNLNKGMVGSDVYVCYKKSQSCGRKLAYKPAVLDCFPQPERIEESLAQNVPMFCLPMGAVIESWPAQCRETEKVFSTCVLTDDTGTNYYGASLTFYEPYTQSLTAEQSEKLELTHSHVGKVVENGGVAGDSHNVGANCHCNKAICVLSRHPFFESFRRFLYFIYNLTCSGPQPIPIERYISHLMYEVPFPSPTRPRVLGQLGCDTIAFESHDDSQIPLSGATFTDSLKNLGTENFIYAMLLALLEQKILVHSLRPWLLTAVAETICALMFPFHWQCPYIPQCPLGLAGVLHAPLPFIVGVHSRYFELYEVPPPDVTCFDLDTSTISSSASRKELKVSILPKKPLKRLRTALEAITRSINDDAKTVHKAGELGGGGAAGFETEQNLYQRKMHLEYAIREAFLRFMCSLMAGYTQHLRPIMKSPREVNATDTGALFDLSSFLRSRDKSAAEFHKCFTQTQCFIRFIEERSFLSERNIYNVFFDDCTMRMQDAGIVDGSKSKTPGAAGLKLLDADVLASSHTIVVSPPEAAKTPSSSAVRVNYTYERFPERFSAELFALDEIVGKAQELDERNGNIRSRRSSNAERDNMTSHGPLAANYWVVRTKQEVRSSLADAARLVDSSPEQCQWPRTVLFYAYSLWFLQLPSMVAVSRNKQKMLLLAFRVLSRMEHANLPIHDQLPYRILIYLCGENGRPQLATQLLMKMRRAGVPLNAITYGIYHRALMQGDWPTDRRLAAIDAWRRMRLMMDGCVHFKACLRLYQQQTPSDGAEKTNEEDGTSPAHNVEDKFEVSPTRSMQAMDLSNSSIGVTQGVEEERVGDATAALSLSGSNNSSKMASADREAETARSVDPLAKAELKEPPPVPASPFRTPKTRQEFIKEHSLTPFTTPAGSGNDSDVVGSGSGGRKRKGLKGLGETWLRGLTNSPVIGKIMTMKTPNQFLQAPSERGDDELVADRADSLRSTTSSLGSPSILSLVHSVRKQAQKGYDEVLQQGNVLLRRSGINTLVSEAKSLNRSYARSATGADSTIGNLSLSTSEQSGCDHASLSRFPPLQQCWLNGAGDDLAFQLDSGTPGDLLGAEFWMRELLPIDISDLKREWIDRGGEAFIDVAMSSCSPCPNCEALVYDEEVVAGWRVNDSNLNTACPHCAHPFLPALNVTITREEQPPLASCSWYMPLSISLAKRTEHKGSSSSLVEGEDGAINNKTFTVPYLNPLVLRREMEVLLERDPMMLTQSSVRTTHPIIFWNLLHYCRRLDLPSHLLTWISPQVHIRCVYDVPSAHKCKELTPIYFANHPQRVENVLKRSPSRSSYSNGYGECRRHDYSNCRLSRSGFHGYEHELPSPSLANFELKPPVTYLAARPLSA